METACAVFIFILAHLSNILDDDENRVHRIKQILYSWNQVYSPVHALSFFCDPSYNQMRINVVREYGRDIIELGKGDIKLQSCIALQQLTRWYADNQLQLYNNLLSEIMAFSILQQNYLEKLPAIINFHPCLVWGQESNYPSLAKVLVKIYSAPGSTAGVERQHKVGKQVH
jgi:hypothetical protein